MKSVFRIPLTLALILIILFTNTPVRAASNNAAIFNSINFVANIETVGVAVDGLRECGYPVVKYVDAAGCETR